ncbi:MAG TPA: cytochrome c [candidate division Zixibacteria bacterium]|nr:cytochrome c [candidate division Zixibacteria bacterium]
MKPQKPVLLLAMAIISILLIFLLFQGNLKAQKSLTSQELYKKYCASCHGADGKGVEKMAKMLKAPIRDFTKITLTAELSKEWQKAIKEGKAKMPAFNKKLKEAEIDSVYNYAKAMTIPATKSESSTKKDTGGVSKDTTKVTKDSCSKN